MSAHHKAAATTTQFQDYAVVANLILCLIILALRLSGVTW